MKDGEGLGGMVFTRAMSILTKGQIQDSRETILKLPVGTKRREEVGGIGGGLGSLPMFEPVEVTFTRRCKPGQCLSALR